MIQALIFDCFGVLYLDAHESFSQRYPEHAEQLHDINLQADRGLIDRSEYVEAVARLTGEDPIAIEESVHGEHRINSELIKLIRGQFRPHYKVGVLTNLGRGWMNDFFDENQLDALFDTVVVSGDERLIKPDPAIFQLTAKRLGVLPEECVMVDDVQENCDGAEQVGMRAILYVTNQQLENDLKPLLNTE